MNNHRLTLRAALISLAMLLPASLLASDTAKEKRWAEQIVDGLFDGRAEWLSADGHKFLAIFTDAPDQQRRGAVVILHGIGVHPDWPQVIHPLRTGLPEQGWATLSLQMPILPNAAKGEDYLPLFKEVAPRLKAALDYLAARDIKPVMLVGHSLGAAMGSWFLSHDADKRVRGFAGIGMSGNRQHPQLDNVVSLKNLFLPVLDLYGGNDLPAVVDSAADRAAAARQAGNNQYQQLRSEGADHFFTDREEALLTAVSDWLNKTAPDN